MMDHIAHIRDMDELNDIQIKFPIGNKLHYSSKDCWVIGRGAPGTTVYFGFFEKTRPVAVKRLVRHHDHENVNDISHEAKLLLRMDGHPNILRYYCTEFNDDFL